MIGFGSNISEAGVATNMGDEISDGGAESTLELEIGAARRHLFPATNVVYLV